MIIVVDDDEIAVEPLIDELHGQGLALKAFHTVDGAWRFLRSTDEPLYVAVLDVMMPPGQLFKDVDTDSGLLTGLQFYRLIREAFPDSRIFLFTNATSPTLSSALRGDQLATLVVKTDLFYDEFAELVADAYRSSLPSKSK